MTAPALGLPRDHLVLDVRGMTHHPRKHVLAFPKTLRGLGRLVESLGPRPQVWIHESALAPLGLPEALVPDLGSEFVGGLFADRGNLTTTRWPARDPSCVHWYVKGGAGFDLHVPAWRRGSPFAGLPDGDALIDAVASWAAATGEAPWRGWGTATSDSWLRPKARATALPPPLGDGLVRELQLDWWRVPNSSERNFRYLHGLDVNGAFLAVAGSIELPTGEAELRDWPTFDKRQPGLWHVELPPWSGDLPPPWPREGSDAWVTTPTMELLDEAGVSPMEAWIWPEHGRYLRGWQERLRDARAFLVERREWSGPAGVAVKAVYQMGPGRLASKLRDASPPERDPLYQPYWDLAIIAESRCRLWRRLRALPVAPVAVYRDAAFFLSSRATPRMLGLSFGLPMESRLGHFKPVGTASAKAARELLERGLADTTRRLSDLAKATT